MEQHIITTASALTDMVDHYRHEPAFVFDIESMGDDRKDPRRADVRVISFASETRVDVIPMGFPHGELISQRRKPNAKGEARMKRGVAYEDLNPKYDVLVEIEREWEPAPPQLERGDVMDALAPLFADPKIVKIGHNLKYDLHGVSQFLPMPEGPYFDTMIASWLFDSQRIKAFPLPKKERASDETIRDGLSLKDCVWRELGIEMEKGVGEDISIHPYSVVMEYSALDSWRTYDLWQALAKQLADHPQTAMLMDLEMQVLNPTLEMEQNGVRIDIERLAEIDAALQKKIDIVEGRIWRVAGRKFNLRSPREKQELMFLPRNEGGLGIRAVKLTSGGEKKPERERTIYDYSTDHWVMEANSRFPIIADMITYGQLTKLHGTYVMPYVGGEVRSYDGSGRHKVKKIDSQLKDGRIFAQFKQHGAESGRFSSSGPNLQNIPSRSDAGKEIREAFIADDGHTLVVADYSQIEPRIIASLSGDATMIDTYRSGGDVYQAVADRMAVSRFAGKTLVLAIAYGVGPSKISNDIDCTIQEARDLMDYFARQFPRIGQHKRRVIQKAKSTDRTFPWSETIMGRRRVLKDLRYGDPKAERQAYNHLIQGSAADIMKIALVNVHATLPDEARMLMTVHDEVVISVPVGIASDVAATVKHEMETSRPRAITVPLVADVQTGYRWSDCK